MRSRLASKAVLLVIFVGPWLALSPGRAHAQDESPITITPEDSEIVLYFLRTREEEGQTISLVTPTQGANPPSAVLDGDLTSTISPIKIDKSEITLSVEPTDDDDDYYLKVSLAPSLGDWNAGEYTGTIKIRGEGYEASTVTLRAVFKAGVGRLGVSAAIGAVAVGLIIGYLLKALQSEPADPAGMRKATEAKKTGRWGRYKARRGPMVIGIATAIVVLAVGVDSQYLADNTFGVGGFSDWLGLILWGFAAAFSGKAITDYTTQTSAKVAAG